LGVPLGRIRSDIERQVTRGHVNLGQDMQLTPRAKRVIDLAYEEARQLNNNYIGTEHLLLGLIREGDGLAARVLKQEGAEYDTTKEVVRLMQEEAVAGTSPEQALNFLRGCAAELGENPSRSLRAVRAVQWARQVCVGRNDFL